MFILIVIIFYYGPFLRYKERRGIERQDAREIQKTPLRFSPDY